jgi:hypothetical protein
LISTTTRTPVRGRAILRGGGIPLCIDDEEPPLALIEDAATAAEDVEDLLRWSTRIAPRCVSEKQAEAFGRRNAVEGGLLVRVTPTNLVTENDVAGW